VPKEFHGTLNISDTWRTSLASLGVDLRDNVAKPELQVLSLKPGWLRWGCARIRNANQMRNLSRLIVSPPVKSANEQPLVE
jgi:hypothetical protein